MLTIEDNITFNLLVHGANVHILQGEYLEELRAGEDELPFPISGDTLATFKRLHIEGEEPNENNISALLLIEYGEMNIHTVADLLGIDPEFPDEEFAVSGDDITFLRANNVI